MVDTGTTDGSFPRLHVTQVDNPVSSNVKEIASFRHSISGLIPQKDVERFLHHVTVKLYANALLMTQQETLEQVVENLDLSSAIALVNDANEDEPLLESQAEALVDSVRNFMIRYHYARMVDLHQVAAEIMDDTIIKIRNSLNTRGVDTRITDFNTFTAVWRHFYLSVTEKFNT